MGTKKKRPQKKRKKKSLHKVDELGEIKVLKIPHNKGSKTARELLRGKNFQSRSSTDEKMAESPKMKKNKGVKEAKSPQKKSRKSLPKKVKKVTPKKKSHQKRTPQPKI